jgi:hypothetical protein
MDRHRIVSQRAWQSRMFGIPALRALTGTDGSKDNPGQRPAHMRIEPSSERLGSIGRRSNAMEGTR